MIGLILFCIFVFITSIFSIATSALAIEAYNKNPEYKASNNTKFKFLVANLVMSIIALLFSIGVIAFLIYTGGNTAKMGKLGKLNSLFRKRNGRQPITEQSFRDYHIVNPPPQRQIRQKHVKEYTPTLSNEQPITSEVVYIPNTVSESINQPSDLSYGKFIPIDSNEYSQ